MNNPALKFIEWSSKNDSFLYYDKEKQEEVLVGNDFEFIPSAMFHTVKGYFTTRQSRDRFKRSVKDRRTRIKCTNLQGYTISKWAMVF